MNKNKLLGGFCAVNMLVLPQIVVKAQQSTAVNDKKTNIIFILADDMGYCDLACYGNKYICFYSKRYCSISSFNTIRIFMLFISIKYS